ncbi:hypothetical protein AC1031_014105 [Aphanomyces cochlioides]|nr:hypothetical protein AC1031_014105 [Aphanomyces cochlioides]
MDDTDTAVALVLGMASYAIAMYEDDDESDDEVEREQRFMRPQFALLEFLDLQGQMVHGGCPMYSDNFRLPKAAVDLLVKLCAKYISSRMEPRSVILVTLQYLATGASVRMQEQVFQRQSFGQISVYRRLGVTAILRALREHSIYGSDPHEQDRLQSSKTAFFSEHPLFSNCIGAIDGTHVPLVVPSGIESPKQAQMYWVWLMKTGDFLHSMLELKVVRLTALYWRDHASNVPSPVTAIILPMPVSDSRHQY